MRASRFGVATLVALLAAGCGTTHASSGDRGTPGSLMAAARATSALSSRIAETMTIRIGGMSVSYSAAGEFDFTHARGTLTVRAPINLTMLFDPPKAYVKLPGGDGATLPKGKTWVELNASELGGMGAFGPGPLGANSPADLLTSLTAISGSVKKLGAGSARGVAVTEYQVGIDPKKAAQAAKLPAAQRASYRQFLGSLGAEAITAAVWVDGANLVRRVSLSLQLPASIATALPGGATKSARIIETTDFYDFGVAVRVSAPPAAQVASMASINSSIGASVPLGNVPSSAGGSSSGSGLGTPPSGPPAVSGALTRAQATAAERAVTGFVTALGRDNPAMVAQAVLPAQRACVSSRLTGAPKATIKSLHVVSATPAGTGRAIVRFTASVTANMGGQSVPVPVAGEAPGGEQWLVATEVNGHWYVDVSASQVLFVPAC